MEITIEDVRHLAFEVYMLQKEIAQLKAANQELKRLLEQSGEVKGEST